MLAVAPSSSLDAEVAEAEAWWQVFDVEVAEEKSAKAATTKSVAENSPVLVAGAEKSPAAFQAASKWIKVSYRRKVKHRDKGGG